MHTTSISRLVFIVLLLQSFSVNCQQFNLARQSIVYANATCGVDRPEVFCGILEHVRTPEGNQCYVCDASNPSLSYSADNMIDGSERAWQSPTLTNGLQYKRVDITIDLRQDYEVTYIYLQTKNAPMMTSFILEKSLDNITYTPWQYFAMNDEACYTQHNIKPKLHKRQQFDSPTEVLCKGVEFLPLKGSELNFKVLDGRPGQDTADGMRQLREFMKARYIRFRLMSMRIVNSDVYKLQLMQESTNNRYFYSIKHINVFGQCICYGHSDGCKPAVDTGRHECKCNHGTTGPSCKQCLPLYNQEKWQPYNQENEFECVRCECFNHADKCEYDQGVADRGESRNADGKKEGGGVCVDCRHNTEGVNCERCKPKYYRPKGVSQSDRRVCESCDCVAENSLGENCHFDDGVLEPGQCKCKEGFGGRRCDQCARGYRQNYPKCEKCPCNEHGTTNFDTCFTKCECKANVIGDVCDKCKAGFFNLDVNNPDGCSKCFCFDHTDECYGMDRTIPSGLDINRDDWGLTSYGISGRSDVTYSSNCTSDSECDFLEASDLDNRHYWISTEFITGNQLRLYGAHIAFTVYFKEDFYDTQSMRSQPIFVLLGEHNRRVEFIPSQSILANQDAPLTFILSADVDNKDGYWSSSRDNGKQTMMQVLANVTAVMVRAGFTNTQSLTRFGSFSIDKLPGQKLLSVEQCDCMKPFAGNSCEDCFVGYRLINNKRQNGTCEKCECNGRSKECDPYNGHCMDCKENTAGASCQKCAPRFFGNPIGPDDKFTTCRSCTCPNRDDGNFGNCVMSTNDTIGNNECVSCDEGFHGLRCDSCSDGYFGDPKKGIKCQKCDCNGNIDPNAVGNCHPLTGVCQKCIKNTAGDHCDRCNDGAYGSIHTSCFDCGCNVHGSKQKQCNNNTIEHECECKEFYEGKLCDKCVKGRGGVELGCPKCDCNLTGSYHDRCDLISGQCSCLPGVRGKRCDMCDTGFFGFSKLGCDYCACNTVGSLMIDDSWSCNNVTGQCDCKQNVVGKRCDGCKDGHYKFDSGKGCEQCKCNTYGSETTQCDKSGRCDCKPYVDGELCDKCWNNYWGLEDESFEGCKRCPYCSVIGTVCSVETGICECPVNTVGERCEECAPYSYGHDPYKGCKKCGCSSIASKSTQCDVQSGQCPCLDDYTGRVCDSCLPGFYSFSKCRPCDCNKAGTNPYDCVDGVCSCQNDNGSCTCKENVEGKKCDRCKPMTIGLDMNHPMGCTKCFCFNRGRQSSGGSDFCVQYPGIMEEIQMDHGRSAKQKWGSGDSVLKRVNNLNVFAFSPADLEIDTLQGLSFVYWQLPDVFTGDKILSYNGKLRFTVQNFKDAERNDELLVTPTPARDFHSFEQEPLVVLRGNDRILHHYKSEPSDDDTYIVYLREDEWQFEDNKYRQVKRADLMSVLQNIQHIYIRAILTTNAERIALNGVYMDVAVGSTTDSESQIAVGVEECECQKNYTGTSCQDPVDGMCRKRKSNYLDSKDAVDYIGEAVSCPCGGFSETCDKDTCECENCRGNRDGPQCEKCAMGYAMTSKNTCIQCECPLFTNQVAKSCSSYEFEVLGYKCDCPSGYKGNRCEACEIGWYGNPLEKGGKCVPCDCHVDGSYNQACDATTGQCECHKGLTGRRCSECQARHALYGLQCRSCDDGCTADLMKMVDDLKDTYDMTDVAAIVPAPWERVERIFNLSTTLREQQDAHSTADALKRMTDDVEKLNAEIDDGNLDGLVKKSEEQRESFDETLEQLIELGKMTNLTRREKEYRDVIAGIRDDVRNLQLSDKTTEQISDMLDQAVKMVLGLENNTKVFDDLLNRIRVSLAAATKLNSVLRNKTMDTSELKVANDKVTDFEDRLKDLNELVKGVRGKNTESTSVLKTIDEMYNHFLPVTIPENNELYSEYLAVITKVADENKASGMVLGPLNTNDFEQQKITLVNQTDDHRIWADDRLRTYNEYVDKYIDPALQHASDLKRNASELDRRFSSAKSSTHNFTEPLKVLAEAEAAVKQAEIQANESLAMSKQLSENMDDWVDDIDQFVDLDLRSSIVVLNRRVKAESTTFEGQEKLVKQDAARLREAMKNQTKNLNDWNELQEKELALTPSDEKKEKLNEIEKTIKDIDYALENALKSAADILNKTATGGGDQSGAGTPTTNRTLSEWSDAVDDINLGEVKGKITEVKDELADHGERLDDFTSKVKELRELVDGARAILEGMKISLIANSTEMCETKFKLHYSPRVSDSFEFKYTPGKGVPDTVVITLEGSAKNFYMISVRRRQFVVEYALGAAVHKVVFSDRTLSEKNTYHVVIQRISAAISITVTAFDGTSKVDESLTNTNKDEPDIESILTPVFFTPSYDGKLVGHIGGKVELSDREMVLDIKDGFIGRIGSVMINRKGVATVNYLEKKGSCSFKITSAGSDSSSEFSEYHKYSDGYQKIDGDLLKCNANDPCSIVDMDMLTYTKDGLLFFREAIKSKDFVSLELRDGYLFGQTDLGGGVGSVTSSVRVNTGSKVSLELGLIRADYSTGQLGLELRVKRDGVDDEELVSLFPLNINYTGLGFAPENDTFVWVGGVSNAVKTDPDSLLGKRVKFNDGFVGCLQHTSAFGHPAFNELVMQSVHVSNSACDVELNKITNRMMFTAPHRDITVSDTGAFLTFGKPFGPRDSIAFSFKTQQPNAILLYMPSIEVPKLKRALDKKSFFSFTLVEGILRFRIGVVESTDNLMLKSAGQLNDELVHTVLLTRDDAAITLFVDDVRVANDTFDPVAIIGFDKPELLIGGTFENFDPPSGEVDVLESLDGCFSELAFDYKDISFNSLRIADSDFKSCEPMQDNKPAPRLNDGPVDDETEMKIVKKTMRFHAKREHIDDYFKKVILAPQPLKQTTAMVTTSTTPQSTRVPLPPCASRDGTLDENAIANSFRFVNSTRITKRTQYPRRLIPNDENELEFEIEFDFRPAEGVTDGVLFYIHSKAGASSFILVALHKSVITMAYRRVSNNEDTKQYDIDVTERWSVMTYDLVQFFNLKFTYSNSKNIFRLLIDNIDEINAPADKIPGRFNFKRQFWLGGVSGPQVDDNPLFQDKPGLKTAFVGCIKNFKFLGITWIDQVESQGRCYSYGDDDFAPPLEANRDVGMLFKGTDMDYAKYLNPTSDGEDFSVKFTITTQSDSGMLMHARNVDKTTNVTVFLQDKQVFLEMTSPRGTMQMAMSDVSVCDLKSHTVGVTVTADELTATLDDHEDTRLLSGWGLGSDFVQLRSDPIWFGGVGKNSGVNIEPFVGCFRVDSVGTVSKLGGYTSDLWDISSTVGRDCPRLTEDE